MRLTAFQIGPTAPTLRPASPRRQWMDATTRKFAYRCLPLTIANQHGWELLCPCSFEALWSGGSSIGAVRVVRLGGGKERMADSHFGEGVITFHPGYLFRTDAPHNLMVTGPINTRKDGIVPLTGIVETDWLPFGFTMNWAFTRPGVVVRFEEGEPFCQVFPLDCALVESVQPEIRALASEPGLQAQYNGWSSTRNAFNQGLQDPQSQASQDQWQRYYNRGTLHTGEPVEATHRTRLKLCPFAHAAPDANGQEGNASEAAHSHATAEQHEHAGAAD